MMSRKTSIRVQKLLIGYFLIAVCALGPLHFAHAQKIIQKKENQEKAEEVSFGKVWGEISSHSHLQEGAKLDVQSGEASLSRAKRHWLPRLYLDVKSYQTNDPAMAFMGALEQRKIDATDFNPQSLNHPDKEKFTRGALGVDLALYEGGAKSHSQKFQEYSLKSKNYRQEQYRVEEYSQAGLFYVTIFILNRQKEKLKNLEKETRSLLSQYKLGQKSNPVGYSGLLGLRSLLLRISSMIEQIQSEESSSFVALKEMGFIQPQWKPKIPSLDHFFKTYMPTSPTMENSESSTLESSNSSFRGLAQSEDVQALQQVAKMENAAYLPRVGLFAESYKFDGKRDSANGYSAGLYLHWELFNSDYFGKSNEAKLRALSQAQFQEAFLKKERAENFSLEESLVMLKSNLQKLKESDKILSEQIQISLKLFKNGSINTLQFVEILNRRVDLISQHLDTEKAFAKVSTEKIQKSAFVIPSIQSDQSE